MKIKEFISTPQLGDTVKVYNANGRRSRFGRVVGYGIRRRFPTEEGGFLYRRVVILHPIAPVRFFRTNYFFTADRARFLMPSERLIPQHASVHPLIFQS
jgi:hypothetical protein